MYFRVRQKSYFLVQRDFYLFSSESVNFLDTETNFPRVFHGTTVVQYILLTLMDPLFVFSVVHYRKFPDATRPHPLPNSVTP